MLMSTVVAVALGVVPVSSDPAIVTADTDFSSRIGRYTQRIDRRGTTHLRGADSNGRSYELVMDRNGNVEASVGEQVVSFRVTQGA